MDANDYLNCVLSAQNLGEDSTELKELQTRRAEVEKLLCASYGSQPIIRYSGSKAKGTLIKEYYDLDIVCYLPSDSNVAGETLAEIYENVRNCLAKEYCVEPKTSALRLKGKSTADYMRDFHIDVVPGRFTDESKTDCFIYQKAAEKCRLKTNLDVHIAHVRGSGVVDALPAQALESAQEPRREAIRVRAPHHRPAQRVEVEANLRPASLRVAHDL